MATQSWLWLAVCFKIHSRNSINLKEIIFIRRNYIHLRNYINSRKLYLFKGTIFIQGNYIHSWKYAPSRKLYSFNSVALTGHSRNIYSTSFPSHFIVIISFIIVISWIKYGYISALFDWRMNKLLMSRVPDCNHCPWRFWYHCAKKYHLNRSPFPKHVSSQKSDTPASEPFILTADHISNCEFSLKIYHLPSFWKSFSSTKPTPMLFSISH